MPLSRARCARLGICRRRSLFLPTPSARWPSHSSKNFFAAQGVTIYSELISRRECQRIASQRKGFVDDCNGDCICLGPSRHISESNVRQDPRTEREQNDRVWDVETDWCLRCVGPSTSMHEAQRPICCEKFRFLIVSPLPVANRYPSSVRLPRGLVGVEPRVATLDSIPSSMFHRRTLIYYL